jgi:glycosyltransferase involved in cell wall biosynthesis
MHLMIFEPEANGHQMEHIRYILTEIEAHLPDAQVTLLTSQEAARHPNCQRIVRRFAAVLTVAIYEDRAGRNRILHRISNYYERQRQFATNLAGFLADHGPAIDFVLLPHLECIGFAQLALRRGLFRGIPWATVSISVRFHHRSIGIASQSRMTDFLQKLCFYRLVRDPSLRCFGAINPYFMSSAHSPAIRGKLAYCPEPCGTPARGDAAAARDHYGIRPASCVVTVFGYLDHRKCIDALLAGAALVDPSLDVTVLLAGSQHTTLAPVLDGEAGRLLRSQGRLIEINRFILIAQDPDPLLAGDISWVFYDESFVNSSSVLVRSALTRRAVIARARGVMGRQVAEHKCGIALPSDDPDGIARALTMLASEPALRREMGENGARAFAAHTPANFAKPIIDAIGGKAFFFEKKNQKTFVH